MKAEDIKTGDTYYMAQSGRWGTIHKVIVLEAGVRPMARTRFGNITDKVAENAARTHAIVEYFVKDGVRLDYDFDHERRIPLSNIRLEWAEYEALKREERRQQEEARERLSERRDQAAQAQDFLRGLGLQSAMVAAGVHSFSITGLDARDLDLLTSLLSEFEMVESVETTCWEYDSPPVSS